MLIPRFTEETIPKLGMEGIGRKFYKKSCSANRIENWQHVFLRDMLWNGIPSFCLLRGMVRNRIPGVCLYFCSTERNSELFSLTRNVSERNSERLLLILFHGTEFWAIFSYAEQFGTEFREFLFRGTAGIPPEQTNCSVSSVFHGIIFCRKLPTLVHTASGGKG